MAKRRTPPRYKSGPKKGQFKPRAARKRKRKRARRNPGRTVQRRRSRTTRARSNPRRRRRSSTTRRRRRTYRRNPRMNIVRTLQDGIIEAGQVLVGKAAARSIPSLAKLPQEGNIGLAVQAGTALVIGYLGEMFVSKDAARALTAGALTAPLETLIVSYRVPWLAQALSPVSGQVAVGRYVQGAQMGRYVRRKRVAAANGNPERGLGRYAKERGMSYGYEGA